MSSDDFADTFKRVFELQGAIDSSVVNLRSQDTRDGSGAIDAPFLRQLVDLLNQIGGNMDKRNSTKILQFSALSPKTPRTIETNLRQTRRRRIRLFPMRQGSLS